MFSGMLDRSDGVKPTPTLAPGAGGNAIREGIIDIGSDCEGSHSAITNVPDASLLASAVREDHLEFSDGTLGHEKRYKNAARLLGPSGIV